MIPESGEGGLRFRKLKFCKNTTLGGISKRYTERLTRGSGRWGIPHAEKAKNLSVGNRKKSSCLWKVLVRVV